MNLADLKKNIVEAGFSEESLADLNKLLDLAEKNGGWTDEQRAEALAIIDREVALADSEATTYLKISEIIQDTMNELNLTQTKLSNDLDQLENNFIADLDKEEQKTNSATAS